jgi:ParB-like chromosome segregation protein Spo0J
MTLVEFREHRSLAEVDAAVMAVPTTAVHPDPEQPRKEFDPEKLAALAASIREEGSL